MEIREEQPGDEPAIREVNRRAFGGDEEAVLVDALRAGGHVIASLVAVEAGAVVGHILFSPLPIEAADRTIPAAALAPMAVLPEHQRRGIGSALIRRGLELCREHGCSAVVVVGHPDYYPRFGFSAELAAHLHAPFSGPAFMALEFTPGTLAGSNGTVRYAPPFGLLSAKKGTGGAAWPHPAGKPTTRSSVKTSGAIRAEAYAGRSRS